MLLLLLGFLASCWCQQSNQDPNCTVDPEKQPYRNLEFYITSQTKPLVSAVLYDYTKFDNSNGTIPLDDSLNSLSNLEDKLVMGLYKNQTKLLQVYRFDPPDFKTRKTQITINPCASIKYLDKCKLEIATNNATKHLRVPPSDDILVMLEIQDYLLDCNNNYATINLCGTFFEIHRPFDEKVLYEKRLEAVSVTDSEPYIFEYLTIKDLCAGKYEIWLVFRSQIGSIIHFIKPFFVEGPFCTCKIVCTTGYACPGE